MFESFDVDYAKAYLKEALKNDKSILRYIDDSIGVWTGSSISYEVKDEYKEHLTTERAFDAIQTQVKSGCLFDMPESTQNRCAAFYLKKIEHQILTNISLGWM